MSTTDGRNGGDGVRQTHQHYLTKLVARHHHRIRRTEERRNEIDLVACDEQQRRRRVEDVLQQRPVSQVSSLDMNDTATASRTKSTDAKTSAAASGSRTLSCSTMLSVQAPNASKSANISPQILRRTLYKMDKQKNKHISSSVSPDDHPKRHPLGSGHVDWSTTASGSGSDSPVVGTSGRFGFMENRISRFQLKRMRTKQQSLLEQGVWKWTDNCTWRSTNGNELKLQGKRFEVLAAVERQAVQKIAFSRLQKTNLGCAVCRPKESLPLRQRRQKCNRRKAQTVNVVDRKRGDIECKSPSVYGTTHQVFGVPLSQCIEYEQLLEDYDRKIDVKNGATATLSQPAIVGAECSDELLSAPPSAVQHFLDLQKQNRCQSLDLEEVDSDLLNVARTSPLRLSGESSKSSLSDQNSLDSMSIFLKPTSSKNSLYTQTSGEESQMSDRRYASSDSLLGGSPLCQSSRTSSSLSKQDSCEPHNCRVPKLVQSCTDYLKEHGLQTIGLFRVAGSAKRCRQLRLDLETGCEVVLADEEAELYPHDVATLLKEYFRDLPDPLLTKELYPAFVSSAKFTDDQFVEILRYLICLLPLANSDTLLVLLQFLRQVAKHSHDTVTDQGVTICGNKMNAHNLATIFGPTILRPGSNRRPQHWSDNDAVIRVVETMINKCDELFMIYKDLQDAIYKTLQETDPDSLDHILNRISKQGSSDKEELHATVYLSSQEELDVPVVTTDTDGNTIVKTRQQTTHRIVYTIHKPTGKIVSSSRESSSGTLSKTYQEEVEKVDDNFGDLLVDEAKQKKQSSGSVGSGGSLNSPTSTKTPTRKITPLTKLTDAFWNNARL